MPWLAAVIPAVVGAGAALYGANKQSKDNKAAQDQNAQLQREQNNSSWVNWLMTRGMQPTGPVQAGQVPQAGQYSAVNTRLPLWATMNMPAQTQPLTVVRRGVATRT